MAYKTQSPDTSPEMEKWNDDIPGCEYRIADLDERSARVHRAFLPPGIELETSEYWEYMRSLTKAEKWRQSSAMTKMLFAEILSEIHSDHPDWSERKRKLEFVKRMYGPTLAENFRLVLEKKKIYGNSH